MSYVHLTIFILSGVLRTDAIAAGNIHDGRCLESRNPSISKFHGPLNRCYNTKN